MKEVEDSGNFSFDPTQFTKATADDDEDFEDATTQVNNKVNTHPTSPTSAIVLPI